MPSPPAAAQAPFSRTVHTLPRRTRGSLCSSHRISALHFMGIREEHSFLQPLAEAKAQRRHLSSRFGVAAEISGAVM